MQFFLVNRVHDPKSRFQWRVFFPFAYFMMRKLDGQEVPYSVTENAGVCSSCAEFFNVVEDGSRKLVRACPGSVIFGNAPRNVYLDVKPVQIETRFDASRDAARERVPEEHGHHQTVQVAADGNLRY